MPAQQPAPARQPDLTALLQRLGAQASALEHSLPSFSCTETAVSEEIRTNKDPGRIKVLRRVDYTANLRVRRNPDGELAESPEYTTVDGKPFLGGGFVLPAYAEGGFRHALGFFTPREQPCYTFDLGPASPDGTLRLDFEAAPRAAADPACRSAGVRGFATLDADGNVLHVERRAEGSRAAANHLIPFASIDLAPVTLDGVTYRLSRHLVTENDFHNAVHRFEADFTACKLFTATVTIGPAVDVAPEPAPHE